MGIRIDPHTLERAEERGTNAAEILEVVEAGFSLAAKHGRLRKAKVFDYGRERHGIIYPQKRVEVIYVQQGDVWVTVTVYVFYGRWEDSL